MASRRSPSTWKSATQRMALSMNVRRTWSLPASATLRPSPTACDDVGEVRPELVEHAALRAEVVVDDVDHDGQPGAVGGVHEAGQRLGPAVGVLDGGREHAVVAPVAVAGEGVQRHQLDGRDAEGGQAGELVDRRVERAGRRERADVRLVEHGVDEGRRATRRRSTSKGAGVDDRRGPVHPVGLPSRGGVGERAPAVEAEAVAVAVPDAVDDRRPKSPPRGPGQGTDRPSSSSTSTVAGLRRPHLEPRPAVDRVAPSRALMPTEVGGSGRGARSTGWS